MTIRPGVGVPLRQLAGALHNAGLTFRADSESRCLVAGEECLDAVISTLSDWRVTLASPLDRLAGTTADREPRHQAALRACRSLAEDLDAATTALGDYAGLGVLDPHQVTAVAVASHPDVPGLCLFDEQGLGKTVEALFAFDRLRQTGQIDRILVFAPKNMVLEWVNDLQRFFGDAYRAVAVIGTEHEKRALLDQKADLFVTNFESALNLGPRLRDALGQKGLLVVDESFFVKNGDSRRTGAVAQVRRAAARCIVLCGTPAPNSAVDLVEQFNIADGGAAFAGVTLPADPDLARDKVAEIVAERGVYLRRLKSQVLTLPERSFNRIQVTLEPRQRQLYDAALSGLVADILATDDESFKQRRASFAARRMALLQACSNPAALDPDYSGVPAKIAALDALLAEIVERRNEKVLIWSFFTKSLDAIVSRYARFNPVRIDGSVTRTEDRRDAVRRFQDDDTTMVFVGNPAAAGAGLTLHRARHAVYESMSNQAAHYLQSLDRVHRRGQTRPVEYHLLLAADTIETAEYARLLRKETAAQDLLGDIVEPAQTREGLLAELLGASAPPPD